MSQFRKDPFGPAWVIISPERGLKPSDFGSLQKKVSFSPLAPGNEHNLGKEVQALRPSHSSVNAPDWRMRVIESPMALLEAEKPFEPKGDHLFIHAPSSGYQEIIIEHPDPNMRFDRFPKDHLKDLLKLYRDRISYLAKKPNIKHVQLTRNVGSIAGSAFEHPHAQVLAIPVSNRWVDEEAIAAQTYYDTRQSCLFCDVNKAELKHKERLISYNEYFLAIAPYASRTPFEVWILPRHHSSSFTSLAGNTVEFLGRLLQSIIRAMNTALNNPPYNLILHTFPHEDSTSYHWHIELLPRLTRQAGFDWRSGFYINPTPPEDAARFLKETLALREVEL